MLSARCPDDARYENTRRHKYFGGLPRLRAPPGHGGARKFFAMIEIQAIGTLKKSKRVVFPSNRRQKHLAQARPGRRRTDPHQREGTIPRRDMGAAAPTYRLSETYLHKMTKSPFSFIRESFPSGRDSSPVCHFLPCVTKINRQLRINRQSPDASLRCISPHKFR